MPRNTCKPPSQRQLKVGEEVRHALAMVLEREEFRDPDLKGVHLTITEVRISPDLKNATAFVVPLGGGDTKPILDGLKRVNGFLRHQVARTVRLRAVPQLTFESDRSFDEAQHISDLLHHPDVARDLKDTTSK